MWRRFWAWLKVQQTDPPSLVASQWTAEDDLAFLEHLFKHRKDKNG